MPSSVLVGAALLLVQRQHCKFNHHFTSLLLPLRSSMMKMHLNTDALLAFAVGLLLVDVTDANDQGANGPGRLPDIWSAINGQRQYHIMFQVQMLNSSERLTVEEWASFDTGQHRLDLVADNSRTTYLTNGKTGEIFIYRPYVCALVKGDASELKTIAALFRGHPIDTKENGGQKQTIAYGLGPLWMHAMTEAASVVHWSKGLASMYQLYKVSFKKEDKDFDYSLGFSFRKGFKFVDTIEWFSSDTKSKNVLVQVRSKVVQMPADEPIAAEVFDIPVGYGCVRSRDYSRPFKVVPGLEFLHDTAPNKATLEVGLSYPKDSTHHSWQTNRYSLSLVRANMKLNNVARSYYASQVQFSDPSSGKLTRQRKVWSDSSDTRATAVLYSINPDSGDCQVTHVPSAERLRLDFPSPRQLGGESSWRAPPFRISLDLLDRLFSIHLDWLNLIDVKPSAVSEFFKEATYELRMNKLYINTDGEAPLWSGPVSIVREITLMAQFGLYPFNMSDIKLFDSFHTKVTIFLYSDDESRVEYKISFNLFENPIIDANHLQQQLDISGCIQAQRKEEFVVEYPIEDEETRSGLEAVQDVLLELFTMNLFDSTPIDPMSVVNFELNFDHFTMYIKFDLLDIPLWQTFQMTPGLSLDLGAAFYEKSSGSLESCAEACEHHNCLRFAFNGATKRCQLEIGLQQSLTVRRDRKDFALFEAPKLKMQSPWIDMDPNEGKKHLRPHEMLEILRQFLLVSGEQPDKGEDIPLSIKIERFLMTGNGIPPEYIMLRPISVHSSLDDMSELMRIAPSQGTGTELLLVGNKLKLRAEYSILLEDRDFARGAQEGEHFTVSSYDECAANCDDFNCRSFSYCELTNMCIVSKLHDGAHLERNSKHALTCTISVLDYLTKFEAFGAAPWPAKAKKLLSVGTEQDCAHSCIEDQSINCQAFFFCQVGADSKEPTPRCYLEDKHMHDINPSGLESIVAYQLDAGELKQAKRDTESSPRPCSFYSRSYLAQFDQFVGKSLDSSLESAGKLEVEPDSGPDACARACIEQSCVAFDVCLNEDPHKLNADARRRQSCRLSRSSIQRGDLSNKRVGCSTFVLSDRSHFSSPGKTILDLKQSADYRALDNLSPPEEIVVDADQKEAADGDIMAGLMEILSGSSGAASIGNRESIVGGSHWLSRLLSILFGAILGVACAILWIKKEVNLSEQIEWRRFTDGIFGR